ncbi:MAG: tetratricopeptide repeat protein, partial [Candidatus Eisenbacteria bacterium]|nr:tetratricopeptide repeat protein [Candidatus Eisenbacteria bacterium]
MRPLLALLLAVLCFPAVSAARPKPAEPDTLTWRSIGYREPWTQLGMARRFPVMDSMAVAIVAELAARRERDSLRVGVALLDLVEIACLNGRGREPGVLAQLERARAICTAHPGPDSLLYARSLRAASELYRRRREPDRAQFEITRALAIYERALPADHLELGATLRQASNVASSAQRGGRLSEATRALAIMVHRFGPDDVRTLSAYSSLAAQQNIAGDQLGSLANLEHMLRLMEASLGPDHPDVDQTRYNVALVSMRVGDLVRARGLLERVIAWESSVARVDTVRLGYSVGGYMECLNDLGDHEEALAVQRRWQPVLQRAFPVGDPSRYDRLHEQARALAATGRGREAVALFDSTIAFEARFNDSTSALPMLFERAGALRVAG